MKKHHNLIILFLLLATSGLSQSVKLIQADTSIYSLISKDNLLREDTIHVRLHLIGIPPKTTHTVNFILDNASIRVPSHKPTLSASSTTFSITRSRWLSVTSDNNLLDTFVVLQLHASADTIKQEEIARILIVNQLSEYVQIRVKSKPTVRTASGQIILNPIAKGVYINPFDDDINTPQKDTVRVRLSFNGDYNVKNSLVHFFIDTPALPNKPRLINPFVFIDSSIWKSGVLDTSIYITTNPVVDTGTFLSAFGTLRIKEDTLSAIPIWMTFKGRNLWYKKTNYFIGSFIKTISGSSAQNELLDIFLKLNLTSKEKLDMGKAFWFGLFGVDAGLLSDTAGKRGLPLNEAMVAINWAPNCLTGGHPINENTNRFGFIGGGLKVFYSRAYLGGHIGITELSSIFKHSYLLAGFYHSPWLSSLSEGAIPDTLKTPRYNFRNNIYFEAAINAFGNNAPKALQFIRLKFGLMLPMKSGDAISPRKEDFIYRLAVEVPIGGALKF